MTEHNEPHRRATIGIEPGDLVVCQRLAYWTSVRKDYRRLLLIWAICVAVFAGIMATTGSATVLRDVLAFAPAGLVGIVGFPALALYVLGPMSAAKTYRIQKSLHGPVEMSWDDATLQLAAENGDARLKWADIWRTAENDKAFLLYESNRLYRMIPKRYLTAGQIADIQAIVARRN